MATVLTDRYHDFHYRVGGKYMQQNETTSMKHEYSSHELEAAVALADAKSQYRNIVRAGIAQWLRDFKAGNIQLKTVDDLKKLMEIDIELLKDEF